MYKSDSLEKKKKMDEIKKETQTCRECSLGGKRENIVVGSGNLDARIVLIGEAPGRKEDTTGLPFVGQAGKLLDELLENAGLNREDIFIGNILKCRPPGNRRPRKAEVESCEPYLIRQLEIIEPSVIAPMGNSSVTYFQKRYGLNNQSIGEVHGEVYLIKTSWENVKLIPLYHPAAAIYRRNLLGTLKEDMKKVAEL
ncbi:uracil-DNA glycosylase [Candidatus Bathyarchaeota archaeon]|nr:uracil-DNA glycosylase [Candidatus Bathyarchaeota archaeon]